MDHISGQTTDKIYAINSSFLTEQINFCYLQKIVFSDSYLSFHTFHGMYFHVHVWYATKIKCILTLDVCIPNFFIIFTISIQESTSNKNSIAKMSTVTENDGVEVIDLRL